MKLARLLSSAVALAASAAGVMGVNVPHNPADWYTRFGFSAKKVPMTDTEWTNYPSTRSCWACSPRPPTSPTPR